jgi:hypothetical protein
MDGDLKIVLYQTPAAARCRCAVAADCGVG